MQRRQILGAFLAFLILFSLTAPAFAADANPPNKSSLLNSSVFVMEKNRFVALEKNTALNSNEAKDLKARFDRFFSNDLIGVYIEKNTAQIAVKPTDNVKLVAVYFDIETNTYRELSFVKVDKNGFWIFAVPARIKAPLYIVFSNEKLVLGAKPAATVNTEKDSSQDSGDKSKYGAAPLFIVAPMGSAGSSTTPSVPRTTPPKDDPITPPDTQTPDSPFLNPDDTSGGEISRQRWISQLVSSADLSMYNTNTNSSFSDVDEDNPYSWAIEIALQNGAIAISEAYENRFYPLYSATEAFAVVSAVRALGFIYDDLADCYAIANDCGIFSGTPTLSNLTSGQASSILEAVEAIAAPVIIDPNAAQVINYADGVITLAANDLAGEYSFNEETGVGSVPVHAAAAGALQVGDCIILPPNGDFPGGLAQKIVSIAVQGDGTVILSTTMPSLDELMGDGKINIQGIQEADLSKFVPSDELLEEFDVVYAGFQPASLSSTSGGLIQGASASKPKLSIVIGSDGKSYIEIEFPDDPNSSLYGEMKLYIPEVEFKADIDWFLVVPTRVNELYLALTETVKFEGGVEWKKTSKDEKRLKLGTFPVPIAGPGITADIEIYLRYSVKGSVSIEYELSFTSGLQYKNGHLRSIGKTTNNLDFNIFEFDGRVGPSVGANFKLFGCPLADATAWGGIGLSAGVTLRNTQNICVDGAVYVFAEVEAFQDSPLRVLVGGAVKWVIWDKSNSKWKAAKHFEGTPTNVGIVPECTFGDGTITGIVKDAATNAALSNFAVAAIKVDGDGRAIGVTNISANGTFTIKELPSGTYKLIVSALGYRDYTRENVLVRRNQTNNLGAILLVSSSVANGSASGTITNSQNGAAISGASVTLYHGDGISSPTGDSVTTDANGKYSFSEIAIGYYTIKVSIDGYSTGTRSIVVTQSGTANQNLTLIPVGATGDIGTYEQIGDLRIVLTWGASPSDLDSHLCGPTRSGADRFHVYYADLSYSESNHVHAFLDHDDTTSYGPETTTVYDINTSGKYSFYVHDYTNRSSTSSYALSDSDAIVRVYAREATGDVNEHGEALYRAKLIGTFYVPLATQATLWHVFDYNAATGLLTARNTMTFDSNPGHVGSFAAASLDVSSPDLEEQMDIEEIFESIIEKDN